MSLSLSQYAIWCGAMLLLGATLWVLAKRRLLSRLQVFSSYVIFQLTRNVVDFVVWHASPQDYYKVYWANEAIEYVLTFILILDFWKRGLGPYRGIWRLSRWVLVLICVVSLAVVRATTEFGQGAFPQAGQWLNEWMRLLSRSILFTQAVLLLGFFSVLGFFRICVSVLVRSLALCWFVYSVISVSLYSFRHFFGAAIHTAYTVLLPLGFPLLLVAWIVVIWTRSAEEQVELTPVFAFGPAERQILVERMELLNNSLLRIWQG